MRDLARRPENDRRELFRATAQAMRIHEAIIEKDFWVCWTLDYLFQDSPWKDRMAFKGGTSLSKVYGAIERFSEDIDLILDWRLLGYSEDEPWQERSPTKQDAFGKQANQRAAEFLAHEFVPALARDLKARIDTGIEVAVQGQVVLIPYPRAFSLEAINPQIRLEIGPLAAWVPNEQKPIRPYAAEQFPKEFTIPGTTVRTIAVERTFWEKATILHQEAHRGPDRPLPPRYSRHYYDVYRLSLLPLRMMRSPRSTYCTKSCGLRCAFTARLGLNTKRQSPAAFDCCRRHTTSLNWGGTTRRCRRCSLVRCQHSTRSSPGLPPWKYQSIT